VLFGLNPGLVTVRRSKQTYGVGVLKHFVHGIHPPGKCYELILERVFAASRTVF
jgi:hypothetical protein